MTTVNGEWSDKENAWVSEVLSPEGGIWLEITLPQSGFVIVRQIDHGTGRAPKCYQSHEGKTFKLCVLHSEKNDIQVFTSEIPTKIKYADI